MGTVNAPPTLRAYFRADETDPSGPLSFVASTTGVGRDGLVIETDAWELDNYRKNPVVLWVHDYRGSTLPIGRTEKVEPEDGLLRSMIQFDPDDAFAQAIERKYRAGYLNAVSVGWDTQEMMRTDDNNEPPRVTRAELLDISAVPVPGDAGALIERQIRALGTLLRSDDLVLADHTPQLAPLLVTPTETTGSVFADPRRAFEATLLLRAGAVLSKRNRADIEAIRDLAAAVLDRADKDDTDPDRSKEPPTETRDGDLELVAFLQDLNGRLEAAVTASDKE